MLSKGVVQKWAIFKVTKLTKEAKIMIQKLIKFRENSDKPPKSNTRRKTINKRSMYLTRYHTV